MTTREGRDLFGCKSRWGQPSPRLPPRRPAADQATSYPGGRLHHAHPPTAKAYFRQALVPVGTVSWRGCYGRGSRGRRGQPPSQPYRPSERRRQVCQHLRNTLLFCPTAWCCSHACWLSRRAGWGGSSRRQRWVRVEDAGRFRPHRETLAPSFTWKCLVHENSRPQNVP